jgi:hypothetical protein
MNYRFHTIVLLVFSCSFWLRAATAAERPALPAVEMRQITVLAAADPSYRRYYDDWRQRVTTIVAAASKHFETPLGLRFRVARHHEWRYQKAPRPDEQAVRMAHQIDPADCDLVVAFTLHAYDKPPQRGVEARGLANPFGQYVVLPDQWTTRSASVRLVHELCHVFGAFHSADPRSVMQPSFSKGTPQTFTFGKPAEAVLRLTRQLDLQQGV